MAFNDSIKAQLMITKNIDKIIVHNGCIVAKTQALNECDAKNHIKLIIANYDKSKWQKSDQNQSHSGIAT